MEPLSPAERLTDGAVEQALHGVLARPPFTGRFDPHGLGELARSWQDGLTGSMPLGEGLLVVVTALALAGVAVLVAWMVRAAVPRRPTSQGLPAPTEAPETDPRATGRAELAAALAAAGRGEHQAAVELAWRAASLALGGAGALTPRQWARWAAQRLRPEGRRDLGSLLTLHEACCYAGRQASRDDAASAVELARRIGSA